MTARKHHDPLADLREPEPTPGPPAPVAPPVADAPAADQEQVASGLHDTLWHNDAAARVVDRWHMDGAAVAHLHGGGNCGCRYLASMALLEAVGIDLREPEVIDDDEGGGS